MDKPEKLATHVTQEEDRQSKTTTQYDWYWLIETIDIFNFFQKKVFGILSNNCVKTWEKQTKEKRHWFRKARSVNNLNKSNLRFWFIAYDCSLAISKSFQFCKNSNNRKKLQYFNWSKLKLWSFTKRTAIFITQYLPHFIYQIAITISTYICNATRMGPRMRACNIIKISVVNRLTTMKPNPLFRNISCICPDNLICN